MLFLCDIMFQGFISVSRYRKQIYKNYIKMFQLDVEHSVPSAHYTHRVDILVVWAYVQIALPDTKKN